MYLHPTVGWLASWRFCLAGNLPMPAGGRDPGNTLLVNPIIYKVSGVSKQIMVIENKLQ